MNDKRIISTALWGFGKELQTWKFIEELGELLAAFARQRIADIKPELARGGETENFVEEMADAHIMAEQMTVLYGIEKPIEAMRLRKLRRLAKRLGMTETADDDG